MDVYDRALRCPVLMLRQQFTHGNTQILTKKTRAAAVSSVPAHEGFQMLLGKDLFV